ncbi:cilia- and flagella-associated protein 77 [Eucyclogobius newberryi]|uniref:cilia- and flagella-associated protein 77 n=1 Tax=Eucyclogobius newberryi TaxID=166745 RepID=UPI003B5C12FC
MTSSPRVGVFRDTMQINTCIAKVLVGKPRTRGFSVPAPDFTFGVCSGVMEGGVAQVLSEWNVAPQRVHSAFGPPPVDYVTLNREAVKSGIVTAKELNRYRAQTPIRVQPNTGKKTQRQPVGGQGRRLPVPDIIHGVVSKEDSALDRVLAHEFGHRWVQDQLKKDKLEKQRRCTARVKLRTIADTRTSLLRKTQSLPQLQTQDLPRTSRYSQVGPSLETFRDPESRTRAMMALEREAASRRGRGQGVYNLD